MAELIGLAPAEITLPFEGLPTFEVVIFTAAFVVICGMLAVACLLFVNGRRYKQPEPISTDVSWLFGSTGGTTPSPTRFRFEKRRVITGTSS